MKPLYGGIRALCKAYFYLFFSHKVYGLEHFVKGRAILAPNHTSFFDPPIVGISWPEEIAFLARSSLFSSKIFGAFISSLNAYPVGDTTQDLASLKLICRLLAEDKKVVIFPEGIRSYDGNLHPIKPGIGMLAMRSQSPIIPVYIHGGYDVWNRYRRFPKFFGKTACVFGTPIDWRDYSVLEKKSAQEAIATKVKESITGLKSWYEKGAVDSPP